MAGSLKRTLTVRLLWEIEPTPEEAAAGMDPVRGGMQGQFPAGRAGHAVYQGLTALAGQSFDLMKQNGDLFSLLEVADD